eukprot:GCRY01004140.1.p1 GENE.GCRY01004140.1~~GCRY01004140.1.p1  ORF type:complete len:200 (+),score=28.93 GCRY01004140.1:188-787(+)
MEESTQSIFPPPPLFFKLFTNVSDLVPANSVIDSPPTVKDVDVDYFVLPPSAPPPPPSGESFSLFNTQYSKKMQQPALEDFGVKKLFHHEKEEDTPKELLRLNKKISIVYLELLTILTTKPADYMAKVDELKTTFLNISFLLNSYRPHQARETIVMILEHQIRRQKQVIQQIREKKASVRALLNQRMDTLKSIGKTGEY